MVQGNEGVLRACMLPLGSQVLAAPAPSTVLHGRDMAAAAGKRQVAPIGDKHWSGRDEYEPSSLDAPKSGKGGKVRTLVPADLRCATRTWLVGLYVVVALRLRVLAVGVVSV